MLHNMLRRVLSFLRRRNFLDFRYWAVLSKIHSPTMGSLFNPLPTARGGSIALRANVRKGQAPRVSLLLARSHCSLQFDQVSLGRSAIQFWDERFVQFWKRDFTSATCFKYWYYICTTFFARFVRISSRAMYLKNLIEKYLFFMIL